jgi:restriction-modification enzyme MmeI-like protein
LGLTFSDIRRRAIEFSRKWESASRERADSKSFWDDFFLIWGISRLRVATFEAPVKKLGGKQGFIDLFWKGTILVEHKSRGEDLDAAYEQALDYFPGLAEEELPKYVLVSDFARFRLYDLGESTDIEFPLRDLYKHTDRFGFILGWKKQRIVDEDPVNIRAAQLMGTLHDALKESGFGGHDLEVLLVRLMFCVFADSTGIFPRGHFTYYLEEKTAADGNDLGPRLTEIFQVLDTDDSGRQSILNVDLAQFPYVNGLLFQEQLRFPTFDRSTRDLLLKCCHFDWSAVSPAVFGSLFQSVMDPERRRDLGGHYTSEKNILKVVGPLFLDDLRAELERCGKNERKLRELFSKISRLRFLDPACGCGNFLAITYRELRILELDIRKRLRDLSDDPRQKVLDIELGRALDVDAFFGVEIEEFPAQIARVAMWLVDHQMNLRTSLELGRYEVRLPLRAAPSIHIRNALRMDWREILPASEVSFVLGNPPYAGKKRRNASQTEDMDLVMKGKVEGYGNLDYVACWYVKALEYVSGTPARVAFVSASAISRGEQVGLLWSFLLRAGAVINFAHRPFSWTSDTGGAASVSVVVVGFSTVDVSPKRLFDYTEPGGDPTEIRARNINPYLVDQPSFLIPSREVPVCPVPPIVFGSMPNDGGNLILTDDEKRALLELDPAAGRFLRPLISSREFLSGDRRWCLWLQHVEPQVLQRHPAIMERIERVRTYRSRSRRENTRRLALTPYLFGEIRQPASGEYILIPRVSSQTRRYIPIGFLDSESIVGDTCLYVPGGTLFHFGILTSAMHMAWVRQVAGRLGRTSDFRYSNKIVYNNFPWPYNPTPRLIHEVERRAAEVLDVRKNFPDSALATLYDPLLSPAPLVAAHAHLDHAVDRCYRPRTFGTDLERIRFLFSLYRKYSPQVSPLDTYAFDDSDESS